MTRPFISLCELCSALHFNLYRDPREESTKLKAGLVSSIQAGVGRRFSSGRVPYSQPFIFSLPLQQRAVLLREPVS